MVKRKISERQFKLILLAISLIICTLYFICKRTFVMDESFSFALSNYFTGEYSGWITYPNNSWIGKELLNEYTVTQYAFNYKGVWNNMFWDVHPPFYHYLLHTISSILKGRFSIWFSYFVNCPCFILNCYLVINIVYKHTNNRPITAMSLLMYTLNNVFLYNFALIRMYQLASTLALLTIYVTLHFTNEGKDNFYYYIIIAILIVLGGLTHYYYYFAIACFFIIYGLYLLINKKVMPVVKLAACSILALILNLFVFFTATFHHFTYSHGKNALDTIKNLAFDFSKYKTFILQTWGGEITFIIGIFLLVVCIYKSIKHDKKYHLPAILLLSYYFYFVIVANVSDMTSIRYMMPMETISFIGIVLAIATLFNDKRVAIALLIGIFALNVNFQWISNINKETSWNYAEKHQDDLALVYIDGNANYNNINASLFTDLRWYLNTYACNDVNYLDGEDFGNEFILYLENTLDNDNEISKILEKIVDGKKYKVEKEDISTQSFIVYRLYK